MGIWIKKYSLAIIADIYDHGLLVSIVIFAAMVTDIVLTLVLIKRSFKNELDRIKKF